MSKNQRIDLHTHTTFSDGALLPSELLRRAAVMGHRALAITDHGDASNLQELLASLLRLRQEQGHDFGLQFLVGVELTHVAPASIAGLARRAKLLGADLVVVHGETIVEPVAPGTNQAAIASPDVDLLAHPGFLTLEEARQAAARGCLIELTSRRGHSLTNGHVARVCIEAGAAMVVDTDTHAPSDLIDFAFACRVAAAAGLDEAQVEAATVANPQALLERVLMAPSRRQQA
jgi:histidinol phosphatase-like PHP family hydrolase